MLMTNYADSTVLHAESNMRLDRPLQPGDELRFNCTVLGDSSAWKSPQYIGGSGTQIEFAIDKMPGDEENSRVDSNTVATLVNVTQLENGNYVITSTLRIILSSAYPNASVSCSNGFGEPRSFSFQVSQGI